MRPGNEPWTIIPSNDDIGRAIQAKLDEVKPQKAWFARHYELFADAIAAGTPLPVTLEDARASIELITAMFESDEKRTVVQLPIRPGHPKYEGWTPGERANA
jgi:predicted dehydrogenase